MCKYFERLNLNHIHHAQTLHKLLHSPTFYKHFYHQYQDSFKINILLDNHILILDNDIDVFVRSLIKKLQKKLEIKEIKSSGSSFELF